MDASLSFPFRSPQPLFVTQTSSRNFDLPTPWPSSGYVSSHPSGCFLPRKGLINLPVTTRMKPVPAYSNFKSIVESKLAAYVFGSASLSFGVTVDDYWRRPMEYQVSSSPPFHVNDSSPVHLTGGLSHSRAPVRAKIVGDSSGGRLAICLFRYLPETPDPGVESTISFEGIPKRTEGVELPPPPAGLARGKVAIGALAFL
jgi:hypothetical protein